MERNILKYKCGCVYEYSYYDCGMGSAGAMTEEWKHCEHHLEQLVEIQNKRTKLDVEEKRIFKRIQSNPE